MALVVGCGQSLERWVPRLEREGSISCFCLEHEVPKAMPLTESIPRQRVGLSSPPNLTPHP